VGKNILERFETEAFPPILKWGVENEE